MVKGRTGQHMRLYVRRSILGFKSYLPTCVWPFSWIGRRWLKEDDAAAARSSPTPPADTVDAWYRALECGDFWFPAQVYNRKVVNYSSLCSALN
ncbi:F-box protein [Hordeum vulgare]|nr:F-box protein [Hordeum vulgare]